MPDAPDAKVSRTHASDLLGRSHIAKWLQIQDNRYSVENSGLFLTLIDTDTLRRATGGRGQWKRNATTYMRPSPPCGPSNANLFVGIFSDVSARRPIWQPRSCQQANCPMGHGALQFKSLGGGLLAHSSKIMLVGKDKVCPLESLVRALEPQRASLSLYGNFPPP